MHQDHGTLDNHDTDTDFERSTRSVHSYIRGTANYLHSTLSIIAFVLECCNSTKFATNSNSHLRKEAFTCLARVLLGRLMHARNSVVITKRDKAQLASEELMKLQGNKKCESEIANSKKRRSLVCHASRR